MKPKQIIVEQKFGFTIHGMENPVTHKVGNFTVTPDPLNQVYLLVKDAQSRVKAILLEKENARKAEEAAVRLANKTNKKVA